MEVFRHSGIPALPCVEENEGALFIERVAHRTGRALVERLRLIERKRGLLIERRQVA